MEKKPTAAELLGNNLPQQRDRLSAIRVFALLLVGLAVLFVVSISLGSVRIPLADVIKILFGQPAARDTWTSIVLNFRLTKALTAMLVGAALSVSGLQMQTLFRNPLADPFILGINSGAALGVALTILTIGATGAYLLAGLGTFGDLSLAIAASMGAGLVLGMILLVGRRIKNPTTLLILGLMFGHATGAVVSLLIYFSIPERIQAYTIWSYGSFAGVTWSQMRVMLPVILLGLLIAVFLPKSLNALLLGEEYARTLGLNIARTRFWVLLSASILAGTATAFCGPIGFLGVAIPHVSRNLFKTSDHKWLLPAVALLGAGAALVADAIAQLPGSQYVLPINVITSLFGAPFVLWVVFKKKRGATSFTV
ncbi:MAG: iron ABC transporter permease [Chloroflexi bacterium]|nr:iron ABC transporter permease [Chloroflexota bacterium]